jgi:hypothetical protein
MVPELVRFTVPPVLLVIPAKVPEPFRFMVPVFDNPANNVVKFPDPETFTVPELLNPPDVLPMEQEPPIFRMLAFVKVPVAPASAVLTVNVPLFVYVPDTVTDAMEVVVAPLKILVAPLKVCTPLLAVNDDALLVKLPAIENAAIPVSFQVPFVLITITPVNVFVPVFANVKVPEAPPPTVVVPVTLNVHVLVAPVANVAPSPMDRFPPMDKAAPVVTDVLVKVKSLLIVVTANVLVPLPLTPRLL